MPYASAFMLISAVLWVVLSIIVGMAARYHGRYMLRWFLISMLLSPFVAATLLLFTLSASSHLNGTDEANPYAVGSTRLNAALRGASPAPAERGLQQWVARSSSSSGDRSSLPSRRLTVFATVAILILLTPAAWYALSLYASPETSATSAVAELPAELASLEWEMPLSISRTVLAAPTEVSAVKTPEEKSEAAPPVVEAGRVLQTANLREGPSTDYAITGLLDQGETVELVAQNGEGDWYQLSSGDWLAAFLVARIGQQRLHVADAVIQVEESAAQEASVSVIEAYVRSGPGTDFDIVDSVYLDDPVLLDKIDESGDWIGLANGGWIYTELLDISEVDLDLLPAVAE